MLPKKWKNFGIKIEGVSVQDIVVHSEYSIQVEADEVTMGTLVSKFEENTTRQKLGYNIQEWNKLSPQERAHEIAVNRINQKMEYVKYLKSAGKI